MVTLRPIDSSLGRVRSFPVLAVGLSLVFLLTPFVQCTHAGPPDGSGEKQERPGEEKVRTGVVASFGSYKNTANVDSASTPSPGEESSAITGSVSRVSSGRCQAKINNNSAQNSYAVSFAVVAQTASGGTGNSRSFSATVKPKQSVSRDVPCDADKNLQVVLKSARKL